MDELGAKGYQKCILDDWAGALAIWDEAIRRYPTEKRFYNNRALCYFHRKDYTRALADARYMTSNFPVYVRGHFREGEILSAIGNFEDAQKCFLRVLQLDPLCTEACNELAEVQIQILCKKGYSRYQAGRAIGLAENLAQAEMILRGDLIPQRDFDLYLSEEEEVVPKPTSVIDPREDPSNPKKSCTIWVGNVTEDITDAQLGNLFKKFGEIKSTKICLDKYCAFVNFAHHDHATKAMKALQGCDLAGNKSVILRWPDKVLSGK